MQKLFNRDKPKLILPSLDAHHPTPPPDDDHWQNLPPDPISNLDMAGLVLTSSPSSSLASLPIEASPPLPHPINPTRDPSSYAGTSSLRSPHNMDRPTAISILNPQFSFPLPNHDASRPFRDDDTVIYAPSEGSILEEEDRGGISSRATTGDTVVYAPSEGSIREEMRGGFWSWATTGDRDSHRREIEGRDKEDEQYFLMRMISIYTALPCCLSFS